MCRHVLLMIKIRGIWIQCQQSFEVLCGSRVSSVQKHDNRDGWMNVMTSHGSPSKYAQNLWWAPGGGVAAPENHPEPLSPFQHKLYLAAQGWLLDQLAACRKRKERAQVRPSHGSPCHVKGCARRWPSARSPKLVTRARCRCGSEPQLGYTVIVHRAQCPGNHLVGWPAAWLPDYLTTAIMTRLDVFAIILRVAAKGMGGAEIECSPGWLAGWLAGKLVGELAGWLVALGSCAAR